MEIKFRKKDLVKTMRRIDTVCAKLVEQLGKRRVFLLVGVGCVKLKHRGGKEIPYGFSRKLLCGFSGGGACRGLWWYCRHPCLLGQTVPDCCPTL